MTRTEFDAIVQRAAQPAFGTPAQVKDDLSALIAERQRVDAPFEGDEEPAAAGEDVDETIARASGKGKK